MYMRAQVVTLLYTLDMGKNLVPKVGVRLDRDFREWLLNHAKDIDQPVNAVIKQALEQYRYGYVQTLKQQKGQ